MLKSAATRPLETGEGLLLSFTYLKDLVWIVVADFISARL